MKMIFGPKRKINESSKRRCFKELKQTLLICSSNDIAEKNNFFGRNLKKKKKKRQRLRIFETTSLRKINYIWEKKTSPVLFTFRGCVSQSFAFPYSQ